MKPSLSSFATALLLLSATAAPAADWAQFRGPRGLGISEETKLPVKWSSTENIVWQADLPGAGSSSPIVVGDRVFVTCYSGYGVAEGQGEQEDLRRHLLCLDRKRGNVLWKKDFQPKLPEHKYQGEGAYQGYAGSTPISDGERLYVFFGRSGVFCFDMAGNEVWQASVGDGINGWGSGCSPVLYGKLLIVNASVESGSLVALDKLTGKEVWRAKGIHGSWNTPLLTGPPDKPELVVSIEKNIVSFHPDKGEELWRANGIHRYVCPSVVSHEDVVFAIGGGHTSLAVRMGGSGDVTDSHGVWRQPKGSNVGSPVYHDGHLYWVSDEGGIMCCQNAATGTMVYAERMNTATGRIWSSPVLADGRLYIVSQHKGTFVVAAKPSFELLAHNVLADDDNRTNASPAVSHGRLLLRTDRRLYCIGDKSPEMPPKGELRPRPIEGADVLKRPSARLYEAAAEQRAEGRVVLRRLNRVEYENTVRDLFDVNVMVKEMLPEDAIAQGFDNVGAALHVSPVLMERYLDAADAVLQAAIEPVHKLESKTERFDLYDSLPDWFLAGVWKRDEGVILFRNSGDSASDLRKFRAPAPGRYRFRIAASAHNSETPLPFAALLGNFVVSGNYSRHLGYFDAPPGKPAMIEFDERLGAKNDTIKVTPVALPFVYLKHETMPEYPGPGLHIHWMEVEGPFPEPWPTESYRRVFGDVDPKRGTLADAEKLLRELLPKTFRRPVSEGEEQPFLALVASLLESGEPFEGALRAGIKAVLASPRFLYFRETPGSLDDFALASRLSYFLWSTMPDETLFELARNGKLHKPEVLQGQVERLLQHPKAKAFTENFAGQWLSLRDIQATTPDKTLYPEFEEMLQWSSVQETHLFFEELLKENLSVGNFVDSDFAMLNGRLAQHYGIPDVHGAAFRKVALKPEYHRGGVLTHASILKVTANGTTTSPVVRGVWVLDRILGTPASPPPPNVPAIEPDIRGATTIREQLARHRATENCADCHSEIDPPGFALENYDVIGGWRTRYRVVADRQEWVNNRVGPLAKYLAAYQYGLGREVEAGDTLSDGRAFADLAEFKNLLLAHPEQIARSLTEKLVTYATGHPIGAGDHEAIQKIVAESAESGYGLRALIHAVVASALFRTK